MIKLYVWLLLAVLLPCGFVACSDSEEPAKPIVKPNEGNENNNNQGSSEEVKVYQDEKAYANFFSFNMMSDLYLWSQDITAALNSWTFLGDPIKTVANARYKENGKDVDKWTQMTDDYSGMVGGTEGISNGTYGLGIKLYLKEEGSDAVVGFITYTYPGSPAEKAGLVRGDVILEIDGQELNSSNYTGLYYNATLELGVGKYVGKGLYSDVEKTVSMTAVAMYEDPIVLTKVFDCGGKKVGYLLYTSFTFESSLGLYDVCKEFKNEGISELILDLRYNGGGYVFTEEVLASMLAPEEEVKKGSIFETEVWNDAYMAYYKQKGEDLNTYFRTRYNQEHNGKKYVFDTSDANLGLTKIYALVSEGSASASESVLVGLLPYMDIEIIGQNTHGKYCTGIMYAGKDWYELYEEEIKKIPELADWKKYIADWGIYVMISMYADKNGENPCMPNGLAPDIEAADMVYEPYPLGDEREALLNVALQRAGKTDLEARAASRSVSALPNDRVIHFSKNPLDGKRILLKPELPMNVSSRGLELK